MDFKKDLARRLRNKEFRAEWEQQEVEYQLQRAILDERLKQGLTQAELAERAQIPQANISRLENARANPSLDVLKKIAQGLGKTVHIEFR